MSKSAWSMCMVLVLALCLPAAAEVIPEDLIVQGKICGGLGCDDNETPPSDVVLLLKDINLKVRFDDVSVTAGFPNNDWQLTPNDSNSGGANKFSIEDITGGKIPFTIMAGAATNSVFIDSTGRAGIGTATPSSSLHVSRSDGTARLFVQESNGTTTARELAEFRNNGGPVLVISDSSIPGTRWTFGTSGTTFFMDDQADGAQELILSTAGNLTITGTLTQGSSRDIKTNFASLEPREVLSRVTALPVSLWSYKTGGAARHVGPMAEDFHQAFGLGEDDKHIAPGDQAGVALLAVQGLNQVVLEKDAAIAQLEQTVERLQQQNRELAARLAAIESLLKSAVRPGT